MYLLSVFSNYIFDMKGAMSVSNMAVITTTCTGFIGLSIANAYGTYGALVMALYSDFYNISKFVYITICAMDNYVMRSHSKSELINKINIFLPCLDKSTGPSGF